MKDHHITVMARVQFDFSKTDALLSNSSLRHVALLARVLTCSVLAISVMRLAAALEMSPGLLAFSPSSTNCIHTPIGQVKRRTPNGGQKQNNTRRSCQECRQHNGVLQKR